MTKENFKFFDFSQFKIEKDKIIIKEINNKTYYITSLNNFCKMIRINSQFFNKNKNKKFANVYISKVKKLKFKIAVFLEKDLFVNEKDKRIYYVGG